MLRDWWRLRRPSPWLFPGEDPAHPITSHAVREACQRAHRVAISNDRIRDIDHDEVRFTYKDYRADPAQAPQTMTLAATEFMRRFLLHVLPSGFHRIRHYGLFGPRHRAEKLTRCRQLLGTPSVTTPVNQMTMAPTDDRPQTETRTEVRAPVCTACVQGHFIVIERLPPRRGGSTIPDTS